MSTSGALSGVLRHIKKDGPDRGLNPEPLAPKARIIPLDHQACISYCLLFNCFVSNYKLYANTYLFIFKQRF